MYLLCCSPFVLAALGWAKPTGYSPILLQKIPTLRGSLELFAFEARLNDADRYMLATLNGEVRRIVRYRTYLCAFRQGLRQHGLLLQLATYSFN